MITIASYATATEAYIVKGFLESQGIECQIRNENVPQTLPIGSVELLVKEDDADKAIALLKEAEM